MKSKSSSRKRRHFRLTAEKMAQVEDQMRRKFGAVKGERILPKMAIQDQQREHESLVATNLEYARLRGVAAFNYDATAMPGERHRVDSGHADIGGHLPYTGRAWYYEVKTGAAEPRANQRQFLRVVVHGGRLTNGRFAAGGAVASWGRSLDHFRVTLESWIREDKERARLLGLLGEKKTGGKTDGRNAGHAGRQAETANATGGNVRIAARRGCAMPAEAVLQTAGTGDARNAQA